MQSADVQVGDAVPDMLGEPYRARTLRLPGGPGNGPGDPAVATLVHRAADGPAVPGGRAVLYVHGFADYFFQTELAEFHTGRGEAFYALDLRRYGRSLRDGQIPYDMSDVAEYVPELEAALAVIAADGHGPVTLVAHSTGGLITAVWLASRPSPEPIDTVVLNSPFLALPASAAVRTVMGPVIDLVGPRRPQQVLPLPDHGLYGRSLHTSANGEWDFHLPWKPLHGVPVRMGWLAAVRRAQHRVRQGLGLPVPVLLMCSSRALRVKEWSTVVSTGDVVLDADAIADLSPRLGPNVTCLRIRDAIHDVLLSSPQVRASAYELMGLWLDGWAAPVRALGAGSDTPSDSS
ncbi:alpha/beta fold hydrolase [Nakamurella sp. YIM 132087]|uniref:Alpha/beta fold hydrolase n=1 Tax=Nakamurella alba TaxID=2665158 RepID=A0A7K1FMH4_9ACTN|nr:alpha/beta hydrolase [Nakamurella alba]MTD15365.1 alpha/beta fold hydrolase [Nakamurella alba]